MNHSTVEASRCRLCGAPLEVTFVDLGMSPLCESYLSASQLNRMEPFYPLHVYVCSSCFLVQLEEFVSPEEIFSEYAYFSSYSATWLDHARRFVEQITSSQGLDAKSLVVEPASNDGYLLQYFQSAGIPVLGVEPARNVATVAIEKGIPTRMEFFGVDFAYRLVEEGIRADLIVGNNVLAQVPDLHDFVGGLQILLKPEGTITMEFPHLKRLIEGNQFDTIYHEHFSYFSLLVVERLFSNHGLRIYDAEELSTHGGSLRIYACHEGSNDLPRSRTCESLLEEEIRSGFDKIPTYLRFGPQVMGTKRELLKILIELKAKGKSIAGYGAPGKGNTLLNFCGIGKDFLEFTVDRNPYKQGKYLPGTHIPIYPPDKIFECRPDFLLILPWNFKVEIVRQMSAIQDWGGKFIVPIPLAEILDT